MNDSSIFTSFQPGPSDQEISEYAFHLYQQSYCEPGRDLDNWRAATAHLKSNNSCPQFAPEGWELLVDL